MSQVKMIEMTFEKEWESNVILCHGLTPYGIKNPCDTDARIALRVGFEGDQAMYEVFNEDGNRQFFFVRAKSFIPLGAKFYLHVQRLQLVRGMPAAGTTFAESLDLVLAYPA